MASPSETVAFIGLGVMGFPMARNLRVGLSKDTKLLVCDVDQDAIAKFQKETEGQGPIEVVSTGAECIQAADVVITMLPGSGAVKAVYLGGSTGILAGLRGIQTASAFSKLIMECGTIETSTILEVNAATETMASSLTSGSKLTFIDAPVSGGPMGAQDGTLTFMVGATSEDMMPSVKSYLQHMGKSDSIFRCGDVGAGTAFKVINNYLSAITSLAASEALNIGVKMGLDVKLLNEVINKSGGQCWVTSRACPVPGVMENVPSSREYEGGFRLELCRKVLGMGSDLAEMVGARTILDQPTLAAFDEAAQDSRYSGKDARVVYKWLSESERK